jgi:methyl-accepting chemotaxis protein
LSAVADKLARSEPHEAETEAGLLLARKAGESLAGIVRGSEEVDAMIAVSSVSLQEQSAGAEQIAKSVEQMSASLIETRSSLNEIARATESLRALTEDLQNLVGSFEVGVEENLSKKALPSSARVLGD